MGESTEIAWTHSTFNPWWGCTKVSEGCKNCYADSFSKRVGFKVWGQDADRRLFGDKHWSEPVKWNRDAVKAGESRRVFCASMADVFENRRDLDPQRARLFKLIEHTPNLDWLLLTKRPENMGPLSPSSWEGAWPRNVWAGCTAESQEELEKRWPWLALVPAVVRFLSCEPQLEPVSLFRAKDAMPDWVITGGESGHGARPYCADWVRDLIAQCRHNGIAPFVKQMGAYYCFGDEARPHHRVHLKDAKGGDWNEWDEDLRVREFPTPRRTA